MSSYMVGKDISALVADIGSFSTKIGYAGDDHPQAVYNSTTAVERRWSAGAGTVVAAAAAEDGHRYSNSNFVRGPQRDFATRCINNKDNNDGNYTLANPVDPVTGWIFSPPSRSVTGRGRIGSSSSSSSSSSPSSFSSNENNNHVGDNTNLGDEWESHELVSRYLEHAFHNALGIGMGRGGSGSGMDDNNDVVSHHPLLLLDKPHTPPALRQRMLEILFETHHLPAVFFLRDAVASCYAVGRTTATVVDMGYSSAMVTPVYEGFVENRGVLRNNACGAKYVDERVLALMDDIVKKQGGRRRKDRMRRMNQRRLEQKAAAAAAASNSGGGGDNNTNHATDSNNSNNSPSKQQQQQPQQQRTASTTLKRDAAGHFIKESNNSNNNANLAPIPDYLMPLYQVRRAPTYTTRSDPFHNWARITLAREIKEMGLGVAVGPMGYVSSASAAAATNATSATAAVGGAEGGGATPNTVPDAATIQHSINPASANNVFLTSSKLPYTLPDGTAVEITTSSRCDVAELYFGNDDLNNIYRDNIFDETVQRMEEYEKEIEDFLVDSGGDGNGGGGGGGEGGGVESSSRKPTTNSSSSISSSRGGDAGDAYSNTSYRGEKANRHSFGGGGGGRRRTYYPPSTISKKLYSACLPYLRTTPPNIHNSDGMDMGGGGSEGVVSGASGTSGSMNENYFHYLTSASPAQMVCDAAFRCDRDQQASLLGNVVVCGGGACITGVSGVGAAAGGPLGVVGGAGLPAAGSGGVVGGVMASLLGDEHAFPDRLREEIEAIVHRHTPGWRVKVTSPNVSERAICSWLGGSILGSLSTFQDMWISRKDYEEYGAAIVNRKCP